MELMEWLFTHVFAAALGAAVVWYRDRSVKRQFQNMLEAIDGGKQQDKDWRFVRDNDGNPVGFRVTMGASAATDDPNAI
jgi:hypothetical protein